MQRRRKRNRGATASKKPPPSSVKLDKSLPSLPPQEAASLSRGVAEDLAADSYADATTEVASRGAAPALDAGKTPNAAAPRPAAEQPGA